MSHIQLVILLIPYNNLYMFDKPDNLDVLVMAVRLRRRALGLSQQDLADLCGVQRQTVGRLEGGDGTVSLGTAMTITDALGLKVLPSKKGGQP